MRDTLYAIPDMTLAENLRTLFSERKVSRKDVAAICHKDRKAVIAWVNGYHSPSVKDLKMICDAFQVSADKLLGLK